MLIAAIDQLPAGDVVGYLLCLSKLSGQGPLPRRHNLEGEHVLIPDLVRVVLGQVLGHGVPLIICPDLLLVTVNSRMRGKSRFSSVSHFANVAGPGVIGAGSQLNIIFRP